MAITRVLVVAIFFIKNHQRRWHCFKEIGVIVFFLGVAYVKRKLRSSFKGFGKGYQFY